MLLRLLAARAPQRWRENARIGVEVSGPGGGPIELAPPGDARERSARAAALLAESGVLEQLHTPTEHRRILELTHG
jgi:hypothetical protein